jgi:hypothetical protein
MKIDRRRVLQTTAGVLAAASLPRFGTKAGALTLVDATLSERELHAAGAWVGANAATSANTKASANAKVSAVFRVSANAAAIQPDLVRQWRDGLGARVAGAEVVTAYVRWDKALLLVGLAREARMGYRAVRMGRSVFVVRLFRG